MCLTVLLLSCAGFLSGSIMYSYIVSKYAKHIDIREKSFDNNPGSSNALKECGRLIGFICMMLDLTKAFIPVYISINYFKVSGNYLIPIAAAPVIGHAFSPFLKFNGGKAVASTFGSFLALYPSSYIALMLAVIILFYKFIITVKPDSSLLIVSLITLDLVMLIFTEKANIKIIALIITIIVVYKQKLHPNEGKTKISMFGRTISFR